MRPTVEWPNGAYATADASESDVQRLCRDFGAPIGWHAVCRDGHTIGYAPDGVDDYSIDWIIMA